MRFSPFKLLLAACLCASLTGPALADVQNLNGAKEVEITADGSSAEDALANCEKAAIDDAVKHLVQTDEEQARYQKFRAQLLDGRANLLTRLEIVGKGSTSEGGRYYTIRFKVEIGQIHDLLVKSGVIMSEKDISQKLDSPTIVAYFRDPLDKSTYAVWSVERINHFLLNQGFRVVDAHIWQDLAKDDALIAEGQGNAERLGQVMALKAKADLVLEIDTSPQLVGRSGDYTYVQCPVKIRAYEASSGEPFITKVYQRMSREGKPEALAIKGNVDVSAKAVIEEAVGGAMPMVLEDLNLFWKQSLVKGQQYRLSFTHLRAERESDLSSSLAGMVKELKSLGEGAYLVRYQGQLADLADAVDERLGSSSGCQLDSFDLGNAIYSCK